MSDSELNEKQQHIINVAETVFTRYGYDKTAISDIAAEAGLGKGTLYYYFDSKEDLFIEVMKLQIQAVFVEMREKLATLQKASDKLLTSLVAPLSLLRDKAPLYLQFINANTNMFHTKLIDFQNEKQSEICNSLQEIILEGQQSGEFREDIDAKACAGVIYRKLMFGDENKTNCTFCEEMIKQKEKDLNLLIELILTGLIKREVS
ncbi:MAG: TetR/AcrR family transcriptional regulator [Candidatus Cloacimonetes bacterium]|nr:TetR/AcrR family transcriptional regulator [Candidatus Cloacimonadota bacterium]